MEGCSNFMAAGAFRSARSAVEGWLILKPRPCNMPAKPDPGDYRIQVVKYFFQTPRLFHYRSTFRTYVYRNEAMPGLVDPQMDILARHNPCKWTSARQNWRRACSIGVVIRAYIRVMTILETSEVQRGVGL